MSQKSPFDQLLDLLLDALEERRQARQSDDAVAIGDAPTSAIDLPPADQRPTAVAQPAAVVDPPQGPPDPIVDEPDDAELTTAVAEPQPASVHLPLIDNMPRTLFRMAIGIIAIVIFVNLPLDYGRLNAIVGASEAETTRVRFARDGMLLQGSGRAVYLIENNQRRWITTREAFIARGHRWAAVRRVDDDYLADFEEGPPIYTLYKCGESPHVYALDVRSKGSTARVKRWIKDIETFEANNFRWENVQPVSCATLRALPQGTPFPADAGPAPQP